MTLPPPAVDPASGLWHARHIELDLVVIGGAGQVGLLLSLAFAATSLQVGI